MKQLTIYADSINDRHISDAVRILRDGGVIIYPTDTMYAIGCDALNQRAIERLCRLKGINTDKQLLSIVCSSLSQASDYARIDNTAYRMIKDLIPGPYTFVLPSQQTLPRAFKRRKSVGIRIPACNIARALADSLGNPVISTSVEVDEDELTLNADHIALKYRHDADLIIDAGETAVAYSTVVDCLDSHAPQIIRQGIGEIEL